MFTRTVDPKTLELLKNLMQLKLLTNLRLVGGTALALQLGHRVSVDIDLFGIRDYTSEALQAELESLGTLEITYLDSKSVINSCYLNSIKLDIVDYSYPWLQDCIIQDGVRMASLEDIAAMKISAIGQRGAKKDFFDMYFILEKFTIYEIITFFKQKYELNDVFHYIQGLGYFEDADKDLDPIMFEPLKWTTVKGRIIKEIQALDFNLL